MQYPPHLQRHIAAETRYHTLAAPFTTENGDCLHDVVVAFQTWGRPENAASNTILICHALTGSADVPAWWPGIIGRGKAFDPERDFIICTNLLGSCYGTTGPVSVKPGTSERYRADFPNISVRDMVSLQRIVLDEMGIGRINLVIGPSLGGMQALEWATSYPDRVAAIVPIGVGGRHSPWCIGVSDAQRMAIAADPNWQNGYYDDAHPPRDGLAAARMMAICNYRSWQSFEERFGRERCGDGSFEVQSYLRYQGQKLNERFDANAYVTLTQAMHTHDIARGRGDYPHVLESIEQPALVVSVSSDGLYPPDEQALLAGTMPNAQYRVLSSDHGHDGFLIETEALGVLISDFRCGLETIAGRKAG